MKEKEIKEGGHIWNVEDNASSTKEKEIKKGGHVEGNVEDNASGRVVRRERRP
ncbi:restriction endonuclease subunit [Sesbania bispinosa]|nr:restriction endonuclease subunit [Sesbania bispinosa]